MGLGQVVLMVVWVGIESFLRHWGVGWDKAYPDFLANAEQGTVQAIDFLQLFHSGVGGLPK